MSRSEYSIDLSSRFFQHVPETLEIPDDKPGRVLLREYGAVFVAGGGAIAPDKVVFQDEADVLEFQSRLDIAQEDLGGLLLELQAPAMKALIAAVNECRGLGLSVTPRGLDSARRNYTETVELWRSRVEPGLRHWVEQGRMTAREADEIRMMTPFEQVPRILELEQDGIFFSKDLSKSVIYSVAPPGTSQHLSLLAFDVREFDDPRVRAILASNGWYQTVVSDLPHFTFLGVGQSDLEDLGLKKVESSGREFWVPAII